MPVFNCAGGCPRLISVSSIKGGNPEALADPEGFAIEFVRCGSCRAYVCDRCLVEIPRLRGKRRCPRCEGSLAAVEEDVLRREAIESVLSPDMNPKVRAGLIRATLADDSPGERLSPAVRAQVERATRAALRTPSERAVATATLEAAQARLMALNEKTTRHIQALAARETAPSRNVFAVLVVLFAVAAAVVLGWLLFAI